MYISYMIASYLFNTFWDPKNVHSYLKYLHTVQIMA